MDYFKSLSIKHIITSSLIFVGIIPILLLGWKNIEHHKSGITQNVAEKHQLLAENLTFAISTYLEQALNDAETLANKYSVDIPNRLSISELSYYPKFLSLTVLNNTKIVSQQSLYQVKSNISEILLPNINCLSKSEVSKEANFSSIFTSPYTKKPTVYICQPIHHTNENKNAFLLAELDLSYFHQLQKNIVFGRKGHAAIVNSHGQIVSHPNKNWVNQIKNISNWEIIRLSAEGKSGITNFFSPYFQEDMISGYAGISGFQWSVIVPQPVSEVNEEINEITNLHLIWSGLALVGAIILAMLITRKVIVPIINLNREITAIEAGGFQKQLSDNSLPLPKEINSLRSAFKHILNSFHLINEDLKKANSSLVEEVNKATNDLLMANIKLQRIVTLDELTGLYNRRGLQDILGHEIARTKRDGGSFTILLCDLDHFKLINDNYGHATGDEVLRTFSKLVQPILRERDVVGRWGGEEFLCILGDADFETAYEIAERLRTTVAETVILPDEIAFNVTLSIGLASFPTDAEKIEDLLVCADSALYEAKQSGRNKTISCKPKPSGFLSVSNQLRCALAENAIKVAFQSVFDVSTGQIAAKRAMARIVCDKDKILKANVFLPTARQLNLIGYIDKISLDEILLGIDENSELNYIFSVSKEFLKHEKNYEDLKKFSRSLSKPLNLIFEINESEFVGNPYEAKKLVSPYLEAGIKLCLNNFCSINVSLPFLTQLPFHYVKVDESVLNDMYNNKRTRMALRSALRICKSLGIKTIASNVENKKTNEIIKELHFDWAQGYEYERPVLVVRKDKEIFV